MIVVVFVIGVGVIEFDHVGVHANFGRKIDGFQHILLVFRPFVALAAVAVIRHFAIGKLGKPLDHGDPFAVHAGKQPAAAAQAQIAVYGDQRGSGIGARDDAAGFLGFNIDDVVQCGVLRVGNVQREILHQADAQAVCRSAAVSDGDFPTARHHHAEVFFQLFRGEIHRGMRGDFPNGVHGRTPFPIVMAQA